MRPKKSLQNARWTYSLARNDQSTGWATETTESTNRQVGFFLPTVSGAVCQAGTVGRPCLLLKSFERQVACLPHQFVGHRFKQFHQGPCVFEIALSRKVFDVRRYPTSYGGKRGHHPTKLVRSLA